MQCMSRLSGMLYSRELQDNKICNQNDDNNKHNIIILIIGVPANAVHLLGVSYSARQQVVILMTLIHGCYSYPDTLAQLRE